MTRTDRPTILTAGYGNLGFEAYIARLRAHGVTHLVDVRSVPQSAYWTDFRRENLEQSVPAAGFKYVYMGDTLGGVRDSPLLCKDPEAVEIAPLFDRPEFKLGVRKLAEAATDPSRVVCLLCGCLRPHMCHRSRLIAPALEAEGIDVIHLGADGEPLTQEIVELQRAPEQAKLF